MYYYNIYENITEKVMHVIYNLSGKFKTYKDIVQYKNTSKMKFCMSIHIKIFNMLK